MLALEGITIVEIGVHLPGSYCTMLLGDLGAEVITIEPATPRSRESAEVEVRNVAVNRNKRSLALDLKAPEAQEVLRRLIPRVDVVVEGNRPGVARRLGADYETLSAHNPSLIYCAITGYGQDGPYQNLPGHDLNYIALGGVLALTGPSDGPPVIPGINIADLGGGTMFALMGILVALYQRTRTGRGQYIDVSMLDGVLSWLTGVHAPGYFSKGEEPRRGQTGLTGARPHYFLYETADGKFITLGVLEPWFWERLCKALGREDFIPHFNPTGAKRAEIFAAFREIFKTKTRDEWFGLLKEADTEVAPAYELDEIFADPQVVHRQMVIEQEHPDLGRVRQIAHPLKYSDTTPTLRRPAPRRGQHTDEILSELGYPDERIAQLRRAGAIQ